MQCRASHHPGCRGTGSKPRRTSQLREGETALQVRGCWGREMLPGGSAPLQRLLEGAGEEPRRRAEGPRWGTEDGAGDQHRAEDEEALQVRDC
jgi:hypothetical protein